jgi:hypothetical protein
MEKIIAILHEDLTSFLTKKFEDDEKILKKKLVKALNKYFAGSSMQSNVESIRETIAKSAVKSNVKSTVKKSSKRDSTTPTKDKDASATPVKRRILQSDSEEDDDDDKKKKNDDKYDFKDFTDEERQKYDDLKKLQRKDLVPMCLTMKRPIYGSKHDLILRIMGKDKSAKTPRRRSSTSRISKRSLSPTGQEDVVSKKPKVHEVLLQSEREGEEMAPVKYVDKTVDGKTYIVAEDTGYVLVNDCIAAIFRDDAIHPLTDDEVTEIESLGFVVERMTVSDAPKND